MSQEEIASAAAAAGITLDPAMQARFAEYLALLLRWNARMNLTAVREPDEIIRRHFLECAFAAGHIPPSSETLLDFGSGAGLPGIPISICRPELSITLAESQTKKAAFLKEVVRTLSLKAEVFAGRVESMTPGRIFDVVTLRAVDYMEAACRLAAERLSPSGALLIFATRQTEGSIQTALSSIYWQESISLPELERGILMIGNRL
ncbi:16S rRNA (guanine(527)-N(7))-methyltransferase RsmG [Paracidobacterium acidisoli]|uniref:Ribosomal RNA small subunit methyltransferase G n=1 Tax=Paracidobacterium acidisoli TaxID=2303751 RepID=A0A372IMU5_9BACT|nr:16S rRNA (guanine(527)-N(7))-methyltransferase RsmG [Paracidobacterium acidisoli]MBT9331841.1 16S rRNA (guanine(527)-N(7))-methyltransferase RsmG [Paracidobacterium acidisoli]